MRRLLIGFLATVGFFTVLLIGGVALLVVGLKAKVTPLADRIILNVDLTQGLAEGSQGDRLLRLLVGTEPTLRDALDGIEGAAQDPRVQVLLARVGDDELGLGKIQELRDAVATFRAKGKFAIAYADSFGEFGPGTRPYYLATAFDEIWLQPMGNVGLTGLYAEIPFFRGTLNLLGVAPEFDHRKEYKTAINSLTETKMTSPHREELDALLASLAGQIVHGIAEGRKLPEAEIREAIDRGPFLADEALQAKLVDRLGYRDEVMARARAKAGSGTELTGLTAYLDRAGRPHSEGTTIALIHGSGLIERGAGSANPLTGSRVMAATEITRAFRAAVRDQTVRAILFRVDSPGGSVVASELIWREVVFARERGKPVVVSMGDVAGSGGYYVAAAADKIVAEPATLTGSIGVLAGKIMVADLFDKLGVSTNSAQIGANAAMFSSTSNFSKRAHSRLEAFLDEVYEGFKDHVASGRKMTPGSGRRDRQRPRLVRRRRQGARARRRARRLRRGAPPRQASRPDPARRAGQAHGFSGRERSVRIDLRAALRQRERGRRLELAINSTFAEDLGAAVASPRGAPRRPSRAGHAGDRANPLSIMQILSDHRRASACQSHHVDVAMEMPMPAALTLIRHAERPTVTFPGGATYQPIIGDDADSGVPVRTGIQTSPPDYQTRVHSHPYVEVLTVLEGRGEAWLAGEEGVVPLEPGVSIVLPANRQHAFRVVGDQPLVTFGIHTSGKRIVDYAESRPATAGCFPSALRRGTLDRSRQHGDKPMAISRFDLTQPPGPRMSRCVVRDNTVYLAGLTASDASQDIKGQTKQILDKIDGYLAQAGTSKSNLLSANLWIKDMALFAEMNSVWNAWVDPENPPARACVKADLARPDLLVEIMVTAAK